MPLIELTGVSKHYAIDRNTVTAINDVDLTIDVGQYVAIVGSSGSGKSTLLHLIGCIDTPSLGEYVLNGQRVSALDESQLARIRNHLIGFVFQNCQLLPRLSALTNVMQPLVYRRTSGGERKRLALAALTTVGLADRADHHPAQLSGGERQRVAIARALVGRPSLVLADEPTGNLDTAATLQVMRLFDALHREGLTVLIVTHEPDLAARCQRTVELADGRIVRDESG